MARDTLVLQSYRTTAVPDWIGECLASVRGWAHGSGYSYRVLGDELFEPLPAQLTMLGPPPALPATDLARLLWCRRLLEEGWRRVIWLDADIFVIDPDAFRIGAEDEYRLCRELWTWSEDGLLHGRWAVSNCAMTFTHGQPFLARYIALCEEEARAAAQPLHRLALGPTLLTRIDREAPLPQIRTVATLSPLLIEAIRRGADALLNAFLVEWQAPVHAVHLCRSLGAEGAGPRLNPDASVADAIALLRRSLGLLSPRGPAAAPRP